MITAQHLISDISGIASSGGAPTEFKISDEQILFWIDEVRSLLITQSLAKKDDINDSWIQYINCLELETVNEAPCCLTPGDCYVLRSKKQLPQTIDSWRDNWIVSVTTAAGTIISKSNPFSNRYKKYNKYTKNNRAWYIKNNYLYIENDVMLTYVDVAGIFERPSDLSEYTDCTNTICWTVDSAYPVSLSLATQITDIVLKTKVNPFMVYPQDNTNDASGDTKPEGQPRR